MNHKKPILLIDQDDVLAEYIKGVTEAFNNKHKTNFTVDDCVCWDLECVFGKEILDIMHEPDLFRSLTPVPHAIEVFERLYRSGLFEMYIVTAAHPSTVEAKCQWLTEYMPFFPHNRVIVCSAKYMVKGDFLLDDGMHNITAFDECGGTAVIFNKPHNIGVEGDYDRINNWLEFEQYIINKCYKDQVAVYFNKGA